MFRIHTIKKLGLLICGLLLAFQVQAQQAAISGKVTDASTGEPLPGTSVVIKGTTTGSVTDLDGNYKISASTGDVLVFSFVGYKPIEMNVQNSSMMDVQLEPETIGMDEIVVIGYGKATKDDLTGSVTVVSTDDFNKGSITSAEQLLMGKSAGVQITSAGGAPGSETTIRIRGGSSLSSTNDPLIVIDGVPIATDGINGLLNPLSTLNPDDIESFTVLKDASATAIYGSRASNGVIIITTKKGTKGKKLHMNYSGKVSLATPASKIDVLSASEFTDLINERYADNPRAQDLLDTFDTDWQDEILQNALGTDHSFSVSGNINEFFPYRASAGYAYEDGTLMTSHMQRYTGSLNLTPTLLNNHLTIGINLKGMQVNTRFADKGALNNAVTFAPTAPVMSGDTAFGGYFTWLNSTGDPITIAPRNPVAQLELRDDRSTVNRVIANAQVDYKVHFLPDLTLTVNAGTDRSESDGENIVPEIAPWDNQEGRFTYYNQTKQNDLLDIYANYEKKIESIHSKISATAGYSYQYFYSNPFSETLKGNKMDTVTKGIHRTTDYVIMSYFGRLNYILAEKYLFTATLRQDMTSRFSEENRKGLFPSFAIAWNMKKESFLSNLDQISELKLRAGYGVTGQQYVNNDDYPYFGTYTYSTPTAQYLFGNNYYQTLRPEGYNSALKWEETTTLNLALDYGFLNNRFMGSLEFYKRETTDLINNVPLPIGTNFVNRFDQNIGSLENKGVEFSIDAKAISTKDLVWEIGFNASYNVNEITKLTLVQDSTYKGVETGGIGGGVGNNIQIHTVGYPASSFYVYEQVYNINGKPIEGVYVDRNEDGQLTVDDKYHYKKPAPDLFIGISSSLTYKDFTISFSGRMNLGNYVYNNIESQFTDYGGMYNSVGYISNRQSNLTGFSNVQYWSDYYIENAAFFRMDHITASYNFGKIINQISNFSIFGTVQNAFVITGYNGLDPEISNGIDNSVYPRPRTYTFGVKLDF